MAALLIEPSSRKPYLALARDTLARQAAGGSRRGKKSQSTVGGFTVQGASACKCCLPWQCSLAATLPSRPRLPMPR